MDMYQVMKALREVKFSGAAEPDHVPQLVGDTRSASRRYGLLHRLYAGAAAAGE